MRYVIVGLMKGDIMYSVYYYPACGTCKKALKWLEANEIQVVLKHIVEDTPSLEILQEAYEKSGLTLNKFFNTSGKKYRELNMKERQKEMTEDEILALLASEGMLIKRPILIGEDFALVGFKEAQWDEKVQ